MTLFTRIVSLPSRRGRGPSSEGERHAAPRPMTRIWTPHAAASSSVSPPSPFLQGFASPPSGPIAAACLPNPPRSPSRRLPIGRSAPRTSACCAQVARLTAERDAALARAQPASEPAAPSHRRRGRRLRNLGTPRPPRSRRRMDSPSRRPSIQFRPRISGVVGACIPAGRRSSVIRPNRAAAPRSLSGLRIA